MTTDYIILDTYDKQDSLERLIQTIANLPKGSTEIMCHPGYVDDTTRKISNYTQGREFELNVFRRRSIHQALAKNGVRLIHFGQLAASKTTTMPLIHKPLRAPGIHVKPRHPKRSTKRSSILVKNRRKKNGSSSFDTSHSTRLTKKQKINPHEQTAPNFIVRGCL